METEACEGRDTVRSGRLPATCGLREQWNRLNDRQRFQQVEDRGRALRGVPAHACRKRLVGDRATSNTLGERPVRDRCWPRPVLGISTPVRAHQRQSRAITGYSAYVLEIP